MDFAETEAFAQGYAKQQNSKGSQERYHFGIRLSPFNDLGNSINIIYYVPILVVLTNLSHHFVHPSVLLITIIHK